MARRGSALPFSNADAGCLERALELEGRCTRGAGASTFTRLRSGSCGAGASSVGRRFSGSLGGATGGSEGAAEGSVASACDDRAPSVGICGMTAAVGVFDEAAGDGATVGVLPATTGVSAGGFGGAASFAPRRSANASAVRGGWLPTGRKRVCKMSRGYTIYCHAHRLPTRLKNRPCMPQALQGTLHRLTLLCLTVHLRRAVVVLLARAWHLSR